MRITGGEPLIRPDINEIIERVAKIPGIIDLSMTTNGVNLASKANDLKKSGLHRVNISLDTLNPERFMKITGVSGLHNVLEGIDEAINVDLKPIKINTVLIKGINDDEIEDFFLLTKDRPIEVRFIELMPIGKFGESNMDKIVYNSGIIDSYKELVKLQNRDESLPARYYKMPGFRGKIGFISPMSHKFCGNCNRIRLTCDGKIKLCLGDNDEYDLLKVLREEPIKLNEFIREVISKKPRGHNFSENFNSQRSMNNIGG
ncbi:molybdenum cofactor synthesis domain containing protein [Pseudobacteroides cellulosolvens ATCC 35603 = DSM 2933]|uniref:Molybdenum cofactor synthesis domain containing protein n=1 Tax=Pseudobacteroides cellulosolvens ATCC 35603 = DSM 2933 TaxID=398512 RepID=A0A0L6JSL1_9FIRM|nr:molybdenum cofactor synthesis domain containing protein [Pseudobacteroides cellulosolvens ATCC 35603 = DSM 2933]